MPRKSKSIVLGTESKCILEFLYKTGPAHSLRQRCKMVLLNPEGYSAKDVAVILSSNMASVHNWLNRYSTDGGAGLKTRPGQGRNPILEEAHLSTVRAAVGQERQRLSQARQIIEENIGKKMSNGTLTRFLKVITAVTNEQENGLKDSGIKRFMTINYKSPSYWSNVMTTQKLIYIMVMRYKYREKAMCPMVGSSKTKTLV